MSTQLAHDLDAKERTQDVQIEQNINFESMLLNQKTLEGLAKHGFKKPSPIQLQAIPMGRCGFDLIIKAKSGTGKTAVFGIICLEMINIDINNVQTLILAPTREIAVQIQQVILDIGCGIEGLKVEYFIGGTAIEDDLIKLKNQCHIAVGAPGRIKHLIKNKSLQVNFVRLFVLDEADKLMDGNYQNDINYIYNKLQGRKQLIAASATYPNELDLFLTKYMRSPTHITAENAIPVLLGLKQFVSVVKSHINVIQQLNYRLEELNRVLKNIRFTQCIVFSNYQLRAESLSNYLNQLGWSATFVSAAQKQQDRLNAVSQLKELKCRVLTTTDLIARGIDAANVDLVINYEVPHDTETYLHRMGRAGRYGSNGICVTIVSEGKEVEKLQEIFRGVGGSEVEIMKFPQNEDVPKDFWTCDLNKFERFNYNKVETHEIPSTSGIQHQNLDHLTLERVNLQETQDSLLTNPKIITPEPETSKIPNQTTNQDHSTPMEVNSTPAEENQYLNSEQQDDHNNFPPTPSNFTLVHKKSKKYSKKDKKNQATKNNFESIAANVLTSNSPIPEETPKTNEPIQPSNPSKVLTTDSKYENEASGYQENLTLNKNIALYNLTKFVVQDKEAINQDSIKSIDSLLNIIDQEDKMQQSEVDPNNLVYKILSLKPKSKTLTEVNVFEGIKMDEPEPMVLEPIKIGWQIVENTTREIPVKTYLETPKRHCDCSEDLPTQAYLYATSKTAVHWTNYLCQKHSELEDAAPEAEEDDYFEEMTDDLPPFPNMAESLNPAEQLTFGDFDGYVSGYSAQAKQDYLTGYSKKPRSNLKSSTTKPNEKYQLQLKYCSEVLETYAPYISDVDQMDKWYDMWRENLNAVRTNIQQEIFAEEVLRKQTK